MARLSETNVGRKSGGTRLPSPAAGAYLLIPINLVDLAGDTSAYVYTLDSLLPTGMKARIIGISTAALTAAGALTVEVGTAADPDAIITAASITAGSSFAPCDGADIHVIDAVAGTGDYLFNPQDATTPLDELRVTFTTTAFTGTGVIVYLWVCPEHQYQLLISRDQPTILS